VRTHRDARAMARALRGHLAALDPPRDISHAQALEAVAAQFGQRDGDTLAAAIAADDGPGASAPVPAAGQVAFAAPVPILRIFSVERAREFYLGYLGFSWDWEHRFEPGLPLYAQVSRAGLRLHLSEHHGDGSPAGAVFLPMTAIDAFHRELAATGYGSLRPAVEDAPWGRTLDLLDPFGNQLRFCEPSSD
jgi:hypothetical protein